MPDAETLEHLRPLLGRSLLRVERDDAPRDEILAGEEFLPRAICFGGPEAQAHRDGDQKPEPHAGTLLVFVSRVFNPVSAIEPRVENP
jgi:hypothetical protein